MGIQLFRIFRSITEIPLSDIHSVNLYPFRVKESDIWLFLLKFRILRMYMVRQRLQPEYSDMSMHRP